MVWSLRIPSTSVHFASATLATVVRTTLIMCTTVLTPHRVQSCLPPTIVHDTAETVQGSLRRGPAQCVLMCVFEPTKAPGGGGRTHLTAVKAGRETIYVKEALATRVETLLQCLIRWFECVRDVLLQLPRWSPRDSKHLCMLGLFPLAHFDKQPDNEKPQASELENYYSALSDETLEGVWKNAHSSFPPEHVLRVKQEGNTVQKHTIKNHSGFQERYGRIEDTY